MGVGKGGGGCVYGTGGGGEGGREGVCVCGGGEREGGREREKRVMAVTKLLISHLLPRFQIAFTHKTNSIPQPY